MASRTSTIILRPRFLSACARPVIDQYDLTTGLALALGHVVQRLGCGARGLRLGRNDSDLSRHYCI